jgi:hypothetical protein
MASFCETLTANLSPTCAAIKKAGGLDKRAWLAKLADVASIANGTGNLITALTFEATKGFITLTGKMEKNNSTMALNVGENYNLRTHSFNFVAYYLTAVDLAAIDALIDQEQVCIFVETNAGTIEAYGINLGTNYDNFGLNVTALDGGSGTAKLDASQLALTFSGDHENLQLIFSDPLGTPIGLAADIAYLDALITGV